MTQIIEIMLTTIEHKLAAIKSINEEKDGVDAQLNKILHVKDIQNQVMSVSFSTEKDSFYFQLDTEAISYLTNSVKVSLEMKRKEIITRATELMK